MNSFGTTSKSAYLWLPCEHTKIGSKKIGVQEHSSETWREVLSRAFVSFFLEKPESKAEVAQRIATLITICTLSFLSYTAIKDPSLLIALAGRPREERSIVEILANEGDTAKSVSIYLEDWFYEHKPELLAFVSWERLRETTVVWVRPRSGAEIRTGAQPLPEFIREIGGPFMFGDCGYVDSVAYPGKFLMGCPVGNEYDVWGFVVAIVEPEHLNYSLRSVATLAARIARAVY